MEVVAERNALERELHELTARRDGASSVTALLPWLMRATAFMINRDTNRLTAWGIHTIGLILEVLITYARDNRGMPEDLAVWLETNIVPLFLGSDVVLTAAEQEVVRSVMRLLLQLRKRMPYEE